MFIYYRFQPRHIMISLFHHNKNGKREKKGRRKKSLDSGITSWLCPCCPSSSTSTDTSSNGHASWHAHGHAGSRRHNGPVQYCDDDCKYESIPDWYLNALTQFRWTVSCVRVDQKTGRVFTGSLDSSSDIFYGCVYSDSESCRCVLGISRVLLPYLGRREREKPLLYDTELVRSRYRSGKEELRNECQGIVFEIMVSVTFQSSTVCSIEICVKDIIHSESTSLPWVASLSAYGGG